MHEMHIVQVEDTTQVHVGVVFINAEADDFITHH